MDNTGIYKKFLVKRLDGSSDPGNKHEKCEYFVLDWEHDKFAIPAILAYANACEKEFPVLSKELKEKAEYYLKNNLEKQLKSLTLEDFNKLKSKTQENNPKMNRIVSDRIPLPSKPKPAWETFIIKLENKIKQQDLELKIIKSRLEEQEKQLKTFKIKFDPADD